MIAHSLQPFGEAPGTASLNAYISVGLSVKSLPHLRFHRVAMSMKDIMKAHIVVSLVNKDLSLYQFLRKI